MLILPHSSDLGDKKLNAVENLQKLKEGNQKLIENKKLPGQKMLENKQMAVGSPMAYTELIRRLRLANPNLLIIEGGAPNAMQVRIPCMPQAEDEPDTKYITGFYKEVLNEFTHVVPDSRGLVSASGIHRGWRDVVKMLIEAKAIQYQTAIELFGEAEGMRSIRWHQQLQYKK